MGWGHKHNREESQNICRVAKGHTYTRSAPLPHVTLSVLSSGLSRQSIFLLLIWPSGSRILLTCHRHPSQMLIPHRSAFRWSLVVVLLIVKAEAVSLLYLLQQLRARILGCDGFDLTTKRWRPKFHTGKKTGLEKCSVLWCYHFYFWSNKILRAKAKSDPYVKNPYVLAHDKWKDDEIYSHRRRNAWMRSRGVVCNPQQEIIM